MSVSGMNYGSIQADIDFVNKCKNEMAGQFETLKKIPNEVAAVYSGDAASQYSSTFNAMANNIDNAMTNIATQLSTQAKTKMADYQSQDKAMQTSTDVGMN